jgi:hypothetical protein
MATAALPSAPSGVVGIYSMVERVEFEPNAQSPERIRIYGAFAYANGDLRTPSSLSPARRGYLYFRLPPVQGPVTRNEVEAMKREWNDIRSVAGTGQAIGFGNWFYFGSFDQFRESMLSSSNSVQGGAGEWGETLRMVRIRPPTETPSLPSVYLTNVGVVKLSEPAHSTVIGQLRTALRGTR